MISKEVQLAIDEIHRERDALKAAYDANSLQGAQISDLKAQVESLKAGAQLSAEDKQALLDAINEAQQTNSELAAAVPANVDTQPSPAPAPAEPTPPPNDPLAPRPDPISGTGNNGDVPLMPNVTFDPTGGQAQPAGSQGSVIETAGGFVVAGGGAVQRAPVGDVHPMSEAGVAAAESAPPADGSVPPASPAS